MGTACNISVATDVSGAGILACLFAFATVYYQDIATAGADDFAIEVIGDACA